MKPVFEGQVSCTAGYFFVTLTISAGGHTWTSRPARLEATDWESANAEGRKKLVAARAAILGGETCEGEDGCWHLLSLHGPHGCTARVYPAHSLEGEPCPCTVRQL